MAATCRTAASLASLHAEALPCAASSLMVLLVEALSPRGRSEVNGVLLLSRIATRAHEAEAIGRHHAKPLCIP